MNKKVSLNLLNSPPSLLCPKLRPVSLAHQNPWFKVMSRGSYYTIEYKQPQIMILPILDNRAIVMVRVYRPVIADNTLELPAGGASRNELLVSAAVREFREETGILISDLKRFQMLPPLVNMVRSPTLPCIFQVHLVQQEYDLRMDHDHEVSRVECFSYKKVLQKIEQGEIYMGLQIAVIMRYFISNQIIKQAE